MVNQWKSIPNNRYNTSLESGQPVEEYSNNRYNTSLESGQPVEEYSLQSI